MQAELQPTGSWETYERKLVLCDAVRAQLGKIMHPIFFGWMGKLFNRQVRCRCAPRRSSAWGAWVVLERVSQLAAAVLAATRGVEYSDFNRRYQRVFRSWTLLRVKEGHWKDPSTLLLHGLVHDLVKRAAASLHKTYGGLRSKWLPSISEFMSSQQSTPEIHYDVKAFLYDNRAGSVCKIHQDGLP